MLNEDNAIEVRHLVIRYKCLKNVSIRNSLFKLKKTKSEVFEAVRDISFDVKKGEILGVIGKNGSGKSTTLRAIAGIFSPDGGSIELCTDSIALLSIGIGFQKKLTGRENIVLSGLLLGYSAEQMETKMQDIIDFSELGKFIDMPVRTYSSGMFSKLSFAITAILEPEIMLIDEVLSVGDAKFKKKSGAKMQELISDENRTVVIVSHNNETIRSLCDRVLWLHEGEMKMIGTPDEVLPIYNKFMS
ncbi:MAG: ABC transporter ATP-binding protein [Butyrivibrio sp.]|nr:ABC transporter ATP-binding protein [Butyrivibrio sp.]